MLKQHWTAVSEGMCWQWNTRTWAGSVFGNLLGAADGTLHVADEAACAPNQHSNGNLSVLSHRTIPFVLCRWHSHMELFVSEACTAC